MAEAEATRANADVQRYQELYARDEVSRQQLDQAIAAARTANAQVEAARGRVAAAEAQVNQARAAQTTQAEQARRAQEERAEKGRQRTIAAELEWVRTNPKGRRTKSRARLARYEELVAQGEFEPVGVTTEESTWLGVPLKAEDRTIGVLAVQSYTGDVGYAEQDKDLLVQFPIVQSRNQLVVLAITHMCQL